MLAVSIFALGAATAVMPAAPDPILVRMLTLYDEICLRAFPDDRSLDALMAAKGATALTAEQIKVTLRDDPGRGWLIDDGDNTIQVTLELPPYHACSVRRMTPHGFDDLSAYRALADEYQKARPAFAPSAPLDGDLGELHVHAVGEQRELADGRTETMLVFDQHIADAARRAAGENRVSIRFVHQIVERGAH